MRYRKQTRNENYYVQYFWESYSCLKIEKKKSSIRSRFIYMCKFWWFFFFEKKFLLTYLAVSSYDTAIFLFFFAFFPVYFRYVKYTEYFFHFCDSCHKRNRIKSRCFRRSMLNFDSPLKLLDLRDIRTNLKIVLARKVLDLLSSRDNNFDWLCLYEKHYYHFFSTFEISCQDKYI